MADITVTLDASAQRDWAIEVLDVPGKAIDCSVK